VALGDPDPSYLPALAEAGVTELVVVAAPPEDPADVPEWVADLAREWAPPGPGC